MRLTGFSDNESVKSINVSLAVFLSLVQQQKQINNLVMFYIIMNFAMFLYHICAHSWTALRCLHSSLQFLYG